MQYKSLPKSCQMKYLQYAFMLFVVSALQLSTVEKFDNHSLDKNMNSNNRATYIAKFSVLLFKAELISSLQYLNLKFKVSSSSCNMLIHLHEDMTITMYMSCLSLQCL